jgi:HK97 family phage major capsid protein
MRELLDRQSRIHTELKGIVDAPAGTDGDLSEEQETRAADLQAQMAKVKRLIDVQADIDETERRMSGTPVTGDPKLDKEMRSFSLSRAVQHMLGTKVDAGRELEISAELARREQRSTEGFFMPYSFFEQRADVIATTAPTAGPGSNMIGTDHLGNQLIDLLREANPLTGLGVRTLTGLVGNVEIPKLKQSTSVGWFGENSAILQTDAKFDKVMLSPKHVGAWAEYSRNMLLQSSPDIESILRSDLAQVLGLEVARATINSTGTNAQPLGILNQTGIQEVAMPTDPMQYVPVLADALFTSNVPNVAFLANSGFKLTVDNLLTTDGLPIGAGTFFRNYPHVWTSLVPADRIMIAGDFSDVIQGTWSAVEILVNPYMESAYKKGNVALRIILTMDVAVRHPESFAVFEEVEA